MEETTFFYVLYFLRFCVQYLANEMVFDLLHSINCTSITQQLKTWKPYPLYALITNLHYIPTILLSLLVGNLHDKIKKKKWFMIKMNSICIISDILYYFSLSSALVLIACILLGFLHLPLPIAAGEIA